MFECLHLRFPCNVDMVYERVRLFHCIPSIQEYAYIPYRMKQKYDNVFEIWYSLHTANGFVNIVFIPFLVNNSSVVAV